jgi:hypothetical protein
MDFHPRRDDPAISKDVFSIRIAGNRRLCILIG